MIIKKKKVSSLILEQLIKMIKTGKFPPNSKLPTQMELAKKFGVSRGPVREALSVLETSGVIESNQGGGSWVKEINLINIFEQVQLEVMDIDQIYDLLEMRTIIESEAAYLAAKRHKKEDLEELLTSLEVINKVIEDEQEIGFEADYAFHRTMVKAAYNPFLTETMNNLSELHLKALKFSLDKNLGIEKRQNVYLEHVKIYEAIKKRDGETARAVTINHLNNARYKLGDKRLYNN